MRAIKPSSYKGQYSAEGTGYLGPQFVPLTEKGKVRDTVEGVRARETEKDIRIIDIIRGTRGRASRSSAY